MKELQRTIGGNTNTALLKLMALFFMFCDHAGKMCFPDIPELRILGRIAFPLYCWCLVVGASYTRSFPKYLGRIALIGLLSQPLYMVALNHPWSKFNIFLTLFVALIGLWGLRKRWMGSHIWAPVITLLAAQYFQVDYGWKGVLLVFLLWAVRDSRPGIAAVMTAFCLYWGSSSSTVTRLFGMSLSGLYRSDFSALFTPWLKLQALAILALPLMLIRLPWQVKLPRWTGYVLYPAHLVVLILLELVMRRPMYWSQLVSAWNQLLALF